MTKMAPARTGDFGPLEVWEAYRRLETTMRLRPAMGAYLEIRKGRPCACGAGAVALATGYPGHLLLGDTPSSMDLRLHLGISLAYLAGFIEGFDGDDPADSIWATQDMPTYLRGHAHGRAAAMLEGLIPLPLEDPAAAPEAVG